jgi:YebC/PmpR family DNA-binding regulatory protein
MSGHSKWSTIKRKKGAEDAKRGKIFTRLAREITMSAREGGGDPDSNVRLRLAIDKARGANMPKDSIERAINRGSGAGDDGASYEEITYEGYAPKGIALMIECVTDNRNRTVAELRHILSRSGGSLGESGSVAWQFTRNAYFAFPAKDHDFDHIFEIALEGGADDISSDDGTIEIVGPTDTFKTLSDALAGINIHPEEAGLRMMPNQEMALGVEDTMQVMKAVDALEELDDVQNVYSNLQISDEVMQAIAES